MENNICKCGSPVKLITKLYAHTIKYCDTCWDYYHVESKICHHQDYSVVKTTIKDGRIALRNQCDDCGDFCDSRFLKISDYNLAFLRDGDEAHRDYHKKHFASRSQANDVLYKRFIEKRKIVFFEKYNIYLQSEKWQNKRQLVFKRDSHTCQCCLVNPAKQVHHLNYTHVFNEPAFDLISVCDDCHKQIHNEKDLFKAVAAATVVSVRFGTPA